MREMIYWRDLCGNFCGEKDERSDGYKLKDLEEDECDDWREFMIDGE